MSDRALLRLAVRAAVAAAMTGSLVAFGAMPASAATDAAGDRPPRTTKGPCHYTETPDEPAVRKVPLPPDPRRTPTRRVSAVLETNHGDIGLTLDPAKAPCTVQSFVHLIRHKFYDVTSCHRMTAYDRLKVLQCGDPGFTGEGGPGYRYKDELPVDLPPWPGTPTGERKTYARGVLAMANAGPDTNGSQFFIVYRDSMLPPTYTAFGQVDNTGLATVEDLAATGIAGGSHDGKPAKPVTIKSIRLN